MKIKDKLLKRRYNVTMQHDASDCAAAVIATVAKFYKKDISIMKIRDVIGTDAYGTSVLGVVTGAEQLGFTIRAVKINIADVFGEYTLPAIAHVQLEEGMSHFVVIHKIEAEQIIIADPAKGIVKLTKPEFEKMFTGVIMVLLPKSEFEQMKFKSTSMFAIFKSLILPQKGMLLTIILTSFCLSIIGIVTSLFSKILFDEIIPFQLKNMLYVYLLVFGFINLMQILLSAFRQHMLLFLSRKIDIPILLGYYDHILNLPYKFFATRKVGDILTRFQDAMTIKDIFTQVSISLVMDIVLAGITGTVLWKLNSKLFLIVLLMVGINIMLIYIFKKPYKKLNYDQMESQSMLNSQLIESIKNIETVKGAVDEEVQITKLEDRFVQVLKIGYKEGVLKNIQGSISSASGILGNLLFMAIGALSIINGDMSIGDLIVFQTLSGYFTEPIQNLVTLQLTFQEAQIAMKRLSEVMEIEREQNDDQLLEDVTLDQDIELADITFKYGSRKPVLNQLSLTIKQGQKVAIVGESGAGKSTISKLLLKFYDVNEGKITIGGYDVADISPKYLRSKIGYVPQNIELFSGTVINNIKIGSPNATYEQVIAACKKAGAHEFITRIPGRYQGFIEESGGNLSGGEKQRIAIARALLLPRDIYIFDESTSNLDSFSEQKVQKMMFELTRNKTTIIIAHRLSTIIQSDLIVFLDKGKIVEQGTHQQLLEQNGKYASMMQLQYGNNTSKQEQQTATKESEEFTYG
ncbi:MAG: peptidase domain-containing ABC transporter [Culicoidibacterales bacterium]